MSKIESYTKAKQFDEGDILIKDGSKGTMIIRVEDAARQFKELAPDKDTPKQIANILNQINNLNGNIEFISENQEDSEVAIEENKTDISDLKEGKFDNAFVDEEGKLWFYADGAIVAGPFGPFAGGGGGSGGSGEVTNSAILTVTNKTGWSTKTVSENQAVYIKLNWTSIENEVATGNGTAAISINESIVDQLNIEQGDVEINMAKYLVQGSNRARVTITDAYGNSKYIRATIKMATMNLTSNFDSSGVFTGMINFTYIPNGGTTKIVHFILDGVELETQETRVSGRQQSYAIPAQSHGAHSLEVYFTSTVDGNLVESNHLYYDLICISNGSILPIIAVDFNRSTVSQYETVIIPYSVYDPTSMSATVSLKSGSTILNTITVDRTRQYWSYRANTTGEVTLTIECGDVTKNITFTVTPTNIGISEVTEGLELNLSSYGRSNGESNPGTWTYGNISAQFTGFNYISDGWQIDESGITVLRVSGDARLTIPINVFGSDFRSTGKTLEFEIATRDIRSAVAELIKSMSGGRGFVISGQLAKLVSEQSEISITYKENEHLRISFVVTKRNENRLILCYIDGVLSGVVQYPNDDDFSQTTPVGISIGSSETTIDIYHIRSYNQNLTSQQILDNFIVDTQDGQLMLDRYARNNIFDEYGSIQVDKLPKNLPYLILEAPVLPQYKGNKVPVSGSYTDPLDSSKSFTFEDAEFDVQGTSSAGYDAKNYKGKFKKGFTTQNGLQDKYKIRDDSIAVSTFCFKADVASSEGANNVELVRLYDAACPAKIPAMTDNPSIRWGIDGIPIVIFWRNTTTNQLQFMGKYNFNNDKSTEEVFGFQEGDECWEFCNNTSSRVLFNSADFTGTDWLNDFEGRYPDGNTDGTKLAALASWILSTKNNPTKFKQEASAHFDVDSLLYYYLHTHQFLMVDSRAKNLFLTYIASNQKWYCTPYDMDTANGINNEGQLVFGHELEDTDTLTGGTLVFNGQESVLWNNVRQAYGTELKAMYSELRSLGKWSYDVVEHAFETHQSKWPEAVVNEDAVIKYLNSLYVNGNAAYLPMCQGLKSSQRKAWLYYRFRYMDSKYNVGDDLIDRITIRGYALDDVKVTPYTDIYSNVKYGSYLVTQRCKAGTEYTMECPLDAVNDTEIYIHSASLLSSVGDLSGFKVGYADFSKAEKLQTLKLGDSASSYSNPNLTVLSLGNNRLLKKLDLRNCTNFTQTPDLSGCKNIEEIYMEGTKIQGINLPNGGILKKLHLPSTLTNLTIQNQTKLTDLTLPSFSNLTTVRLENIGSTINIDTLLSSLSANVRLRLIGFHWEKADYAAIDALFDVFDQFRGLDENGANMDKAQIQATVHVPNILGSQVAELNARYPSVQIIADHISCTVTYKNYDGTQTLGTETVVDGANALGMTVPSRSSTAQYTYTPNGWSKTPNGSKWSDALNNVTSDRTLYASYTATVRTYTVYWYNGSTLLYTQNNVPYGSTPTYNGPSTSTLTDSSGQPFQGWEPSMGSITGNTTYNASFVPPITDTITDTWDQILAHIDSGDYATRYSIGDTKLLNLGSLGTTAMQIVAFDADDLASGGKAPITFIAQYLLKDSKRWNPELTSIYSYRTAKGWPETNSGSLSSATSNTTISSKNAYTNNVHAIGQIAITATADGEIKIEARNSSSGSSYGKLTVSVDGEALCTDYSSSTYQINTVTVTSGQTINVAMDYLNISTSSNCSGQIRITGACTYIVTAQDSQERYQTGYEPNTGTLGGWENSEIREYMQETVMPAIPTNIRNRLANVTKTHPAYRVKTDNPASTESFTQTTQDKVWLPSYTEMFNSSGLYHTAFPDNNSRKKAKASSPTNYNWYWLRSADNAYNAYCVDRGGDYNYSSVNNIYGVVLGFCLS